MLGDGVGLHTTVFVAVCLEFVQLPAASKWHLMPMYRS